jgi:hypothetical protein
LSVEFARLNVALTDVEDLRRTGAVIGHCPILDEGPGSAKLLGDVGARRHPGFTVSANARGAVAERTTVHRCADRARSTVHDTAAIVAVHRWVNTPHRMHSNLVARMVFPSVTFELPTSNPEPGRQPR